MTPITQVRLRTSLSRTISRRLKTQECSEEILPMSINCPFIKSPISIRAPLLKWSSCPNSSQSRADMRSRPALARTTRGIGTSRDTRIKINCPLLALEVWGISLIVKEHRLFSQPEEAFRKCPILKGRLARSWEEEILFREIRQEKIQILKCTEDPKIRILSEDWTPLQIRQRIEHVRALSQGLRSSIRQGKEPFRLNKALEPEEWVLIVKRLSRNYKDSKRRWSEPWS